MTGRVWGVGAPEEIVLVGKPKDGGFFAVELNFVRSRGIGRSSKQKVG